MPIYAYRCDECGFAKDVLQKISDPVLTVCPSCGKSSFKKQVTAAGFQLKGSGWYVTDFRGGSAPATGTAPATSSDGSASSTSSGTSSGTGSTDASPAPAPSPAPAKDSSKT
jgi:putative FmdB family regulatory protein